MNEQQQQAYEAIKAKTLYAYVGVGRHMIDGVFCVTEEVRVYSRLFKLFGVNLALLNSRGWEISKECSLDPDHVHEWVQAGKAYLTRDIDRALNDYCQYMTQVWKREERMLVPSYAETIGESGD